MALFLLGEKTLLSKIWLAAHWEKKLTRFHIYQINIENTVKEMMLKEIVLDLRLSGHLLIGIVRIFRRKTLYLLNECSSIFTRVQVFAPGRIDLPENKMSLPFSSITLPSNSINIPNVFESFGNENIEDVFKSHQSRIEDITLKETYGNLYQSDDEFDVNEVNQGNFIDDDFLQIFEKEYMKSNGDVPHSPNSDQHMEMGTAMDIDSEEHIENVKESTVTISSQHGHISMSVDIIPIMEIDVGKSKKSQNELLLEPLPDAFKLTTRGAKRKRKLIIDEIKELPKHLIDRQLKETLDITTPLYIAPPSKRLMVLKEIGGIEGLFKLPTFSPRSDKILDLYQRNLIIETYENNESSGEESAYSSIEHPRSQSGDIFSDESLEMQFPMPQAEVTTNYVNEAEEHLQFEPDPFIDAGIQPDFTDSQPINFTNELQVARKFSFLLMLKKFEILEVEQRKCNEEIFISKGNNFSAAYTELCT